jgi:hypothetical protein
MNDHTQGNRETADVSRESVSEDDLAHYPYVCYFATARWDRGESETFT